MRTANMQFALLTRAEAKRYLSNCVTTGENHGDRIAAQRALLSVVSPGEVRANEQALHAAGRLGPWREFQA